MTFAEAVQYLSENPDAGIQSEMWAAHPSKRFIMNVGSTFQYRFFDSVSNRWYRSSTVWFPVWHEVSKQNWVVVSLENPGLDHRGMSWFDDPQMLELFFASDYYRAHSKRWAKYVADVKLYVEDHTSTENRTHD